MGKYIPAEEYIGKQYGKLTIISEYGLIKRQRYFNAICECGNTKKYVIGNLKGGKSTNCGCINKERISNYKRSHNLSNHPLYDVWISMKKRCYKKSYWAYKRYGGRGIIVCSEWINNPQKFIEWGLENNWTNGLKIDRIDNNGNYEPTNCRFVTDTESQRNKSSNKIIEYNGESLCVSEWADRLNIKQSTLYRRLSRKHLTVEQAFTNPINPWRC